MWAPVHVFRFAGEIQLTGVLVLFRTRPLYLGVLDHDIPEIAPSVRAVTRQAHADFDGAICHRD